MTTNTHTVCPAVPWSGGAPRQWGNWKLTGGTLVYWEGQCPYEVPLDEIDSHLELLDWLLHIAGKGESMEPGNFAMAMRAIFGGGAIHGSINGAAAVKAYRDGT
jgi:hypothetical protein